MEQKDPFELLMNIGSSPEGLFLVGAPFFALLILALIYSLVVVARRRREKSELDQVIADESATAITPAEPPIARGGEAREEAHQLEPAATEQAAVIATPVAPPAEPTEVQDVRQTDARSWLTRLRGGLTKTRESFKTNLGGIFSQNAKLTEDMLESLHEALYRADVGVKTADKLVEHVRKKVSPADAADWSSVSTALKEQACELLEKPQRALAPVQPGPWVILVVGVNGVGKTTTIGKLTAHFLAQDKTVLLCAADTFRAAAIEQLQIWGERLGVDVIKHQPGSDPAAVAFDGVKAAKARGIDVLIIDTAGRLHSKNELMDELGKINRTIGKDLPGAPHETWLVIDSTTGQNAALQVKAFKEVVKLSGLVVTKLDGTAKGGVLIGIASDYQIPIRYIGVGEKAADLREFNASDYADSLF